MQTREYALQVLQQVFQENGYISLILRNSPFHGIDQAFVSEIVYGTVRNTLLEQYQWEHFVRKKVPLRTRQLLNMSVYQLFFMDKIPEYAVIHEAVELAKKQEKGFVNAILHKVLQQGLIQPEDPCILYSHPTWMYKLWCAHYGQETALQIMEADQKRSTLYGRINTLKVRKEDLEGTFRFINDYSFIADANIFQTDAFREGKVLIQDIHSAAIPFYLQLEKGMKVLDVCSAPGTKAQQIAMLMENEGEVIACDVYPQRVDLIRQVMEKTGVTICTPVCMDGTKENQFEEGSFDRILLDVPCSGMGDLSHKPEIRYHLQPENLDELVEVQKKLLDTNCRYVKQNGVLVYSTCTLNKKENETQIQQFLKRHEEFELLSQKTFFPFEENGDGFYVAQLVRKVL